jgi:exosortase A-associated hydrolase 1
MSPSTQELPVVIQGLLPLPMPGVLHRPEEGIEPTGSGVVIVNGGAQYRAGSHRLFVQMARHLAAKGQAVLRFDFPGQGDSPGVPISFEDTTPHIRAAIDALHLHYPNLQGTVLIGLCDGASASLLYLQTTNDHRITKLALLNPWVHDQVSQARAQIKHYYRRRLMMPDFWRKLISGRVAFTALKELIDKYLIYAKKITSNQPCTFQARMALAWQTQSAPTLLVLCDADRTAQEFVELADNDPGWGGWRDRPNRTLRTLQDADHTFSARESQQQLQSAVDTLLDI